MRLFDLHCDTLYACYEKDLSLRRNTCHIDLTRGQQYGAWIQVFAVWIPDTLRGEEAFSRCRNTLAFGRRQLLNNADLALEIRTPADVDKAVNTHRCGALFAVEGGAALAGRLDNTERLGAMGVKMITLTWNGANELGYGCLSGVSKGLTEFGKQAVRRMERCGMLPDVSHLNEAGFWDVLEQTARPVLATHSVSAAVHAHPRNLTDAQFTALCKRGGLVGLNVCAEHLGRQSFDQMERHLYRYLELGGERTVALGLDLDGTDLRSDWNGIDVAGLFFDYLCRKNYHETVLSRLFFENGYDFLKRT